MNFTSPEPLENRIAPAVVLLLTQTNQLVEVDTSAPGTVLDSTAITGLNAGEQVVGIDFRPADGKLYGLGLVDDGATRTGRLLVINPETGVATPVGTAPLSSTLPDVDVWAFDFNPAADRIRIISETDVNLRANPDTGTLAGTDTDVDEPGAAERIFGAAYSNNVNRGSTTTLYGLDISGDQLVLIGGVNGLPSPNGGVVTPVGGLGINVSSALGGFDIQTTTAGERGFAAITTADGTRLYNINLATGTATNLGDLPTGTVVTGLALPITFATQANPNKVTFTDVDGDLVKVKSTQPISPSDLRLVPNENGSGFQLAAVFLSGTGTELIDLKIKSDPRGLGDGFVNVGLISSSSDLGAVSVDGDLGRILAGDSDLTTPGLQALSVRSLGVVGTGTQAGGGESTQSTVLGAVGLVDVLTDVTGQFNGSAISVVNIGGSLRDGGALESNGFIGLVKVARSIDTASIEAGSLGKIRVGSALIPSSGDVIDSTITTQTGGIGKVSIKGSLLVDAPGQGIFSSGVINSLVVVGDVRGVLGSPIITAVGIPTALDDATAVAIGQINVGGSVSEAQILAGYFGTTSINPNAKIGTVIVNGDWIASDLVAGIRANGDGFGNANDTLIPGDTNPTVVSSIAKVVVRGQVIGTGTPVTDRFAFTAERIDKFRVGGLKLPLTTGDDKFTLGSTRDVFVRELRADAVV